MSDYFSSPLTEGFVGQLPSVEGRYFSSHFKYPNQGVFYGTAKQAMRQVGGKEGGRAWKATVSYVEVDVNGDPIRCANCSGWTRYAGDSKHCDQCNDRGFHVIEGA